MKINTFLTGITVLVASSLSLFAQENNLVMNGSFENIQGKVRSTGDLTRADSVSSSNNTTVDLFSKNACKKEYGIPVNYMGNQECITGASYAGIIAFYAQDAGIFKTKPGYRKYSEYVQFSFREPLIAGKAYKVSFNASLADKSAYAVSGLGMYFSNEKVDVKNNSFLNVTPHIIEAEIITSTEWVSSTGIYVAVGGERYLTIGCFDKYMDTLKVAAPNTNNSRKAYYYLDNVSLTPETNERNDVTMVLSGSCYQLKNLQFETNKAVILPGSFEEMKILSRFLKTYPYILVYVNGYTDKTGTDSHNDELSEQRALAVKAYLVKDGISETRMKTTGFGESRPIDTINDKSAVNRRAEITICAAPVIKGLK